ncbi:immunity 17 family protein [Flavobacterium hercynium]|uniref:Immunity protein 17 n=1 Tax=Flavobacterium hercynium TaxID=387094 RepID=A0A226HLJ5_9FLAO|nr:immunity 17 family protein [Flavobacterium hercynium]OXA94984.1 hypothetical protein B0A66_04500 [Flavobacterium hercynium]SMP09759.1 Immunity protein 17 [Flavobacterium hercynium]
MDDYLTKYSGIFSTFIKQNPEYFYLFVSLISLLFFIGSIRKWNWIIDKSGNYYERRTGFWVNIFGEKLVRLYITIISATVTILCLIIFFYYKTF